MKKLSNAVLTGSDAVVITHESLCFVETSRGKYYFLLRQMIYGRSFAFTFHLDWGQMHNPIVVYVFVDVFSDPSRDHLFFLEANRQII